MEPRIIRIVPFVTVLLLGSFQPATASAQATRLAPEQEAAIVDTVLALTEAYNAAWEELSPEGILRFHPDDYESGALTYVFERRSGEWKLVLMHESAPVPEG